MNGKRQIRAMMTAAVAAALVAMMPLPAAGQVAQTGPRPGTGAGGVAVLRASPGKSNSESSGRYSTKEGQRLRMTAEIGTIRVRTIPGAEDVTFSMRVETDPRDPDAQKLLKQVTVGGATGPDGSVQITSRVPWSQFHGRLWVRFDVTTPRNYNLELMTHAGNIVIVDDVEGRVNLVSHGGNIQAGNVGGAARMETRGGHVTVQNVGGELQAITLGGHVFAGNVAGAATLRTAGGHIRVASISGVGTAETGGGDIAVSKSGAKFTAVSRGGGQITFGEASGAIEARTAGGGIRVLKVSGPMQLNTAGGSMFLTQIRNAVNVSNASGNITAWFAGEGKKRGSSQLQCADGDIVVYLPRQLALNIEATIEGATGQTVVWDPAIPIKMLPAVARTASGRVIRAAGAVNGGGETLKLHTVAGNIKLMYVDQELHPGRAHAAEHGSSSDQADHARKQAAEREAVRSRAEGIRAQIERLFSMPVRIDPAQQQEKLKMTVPPLYPAPARDAKVQGVVQLDVAISEDGNVTAVNVVSGHPLLRDAAQQAVRQWQYHPTLVRGRALKVVTRVYVEFRLNN